MRLCYKCKTEKNLSMKIIYSANWETTASAGFWWREMSVQSAYSVAVGGKGGGRSHPLFVKSHKRFYWLLEPQSKIFIGAENALNRSSVESEPIPYVLRGSG